MIGGIALQKDGGALVTVAAAGASRSLGNAAVAITGTTIDRIPNGPNSANQFDSFVLLMSYRAVLSAGETWSITPDFEMAPPSDADPDVAGTFANVPTSAQPTTATATQVISGTGTTNGVLRWDGRFSDLERYVRYNIPAPTPSLVNASEILELQLVLLLLGPRNAPTRVVNIVSNYQADGLG